MHKRLSRCAVGGDLTGASANDLRVFRVLIFTRHLSPSLAGIRMQNGFTFWDRLTQVRLGKCVCVCVVYYWNSLPDWIVAADIITTTTTVVFCLAGLFFQRSLQAMLGPLTVTEKNLWAVLMQDFLYSPDIFPVNQPTV